MDIVTAHDRPNTVAEAIEIQETLRGLVDRGDRCPQEIVTVTGLDVAYDEERGLIAAAAVTLEASGFRVVEKRTVVSGISFPYEPGLFAFRELPPLLDALRALEHTPDLLVCDGHGLAHPRRFGLACHVGVVTGLPAIGVGKTRFIGEHDEPGRERGARTPLVDDGEVVGAVVRTQDGVKPVYVSVGHKISLDNACRQVLRLCPAFRQPETTRLADRLCRDALKESL
ncbi:deoxyribonuclease V [Amycolatopsis regifaucium]|uniref:Endonuclease V n=1 Tax=Amycolatopsis regifaucium TaxID=546365 RepID=A0A154MTF6_9PSEU|nr:deoxyribonuclease V [Amycolatopsis regifaucium]KZB87551.1 endonuclease V [Amycolatopsis regifaucium]OKA08384.1 endonuclease V [Amycolatopsis regifaucium]SFI09064.1 Endonuclease V [Amycolatopsis regifaucium]